ncbi:MAG: 16S rRNA (cytosine(1402)-N(4))-methyltransferase RsmH [Bacteroidia bacterium]|nr:16S rRNA (cytosine(1402)-N(4))-methyltransferase RsmH [Bacteroidia bacterium]
MEYHRSVMLSECLEALQIHPEKIYIDATLGGGGHTLAIAKQLTTGLIFAFDQDIDAIKNFSGHPNVVAVTANFSDIATELTKRNIFSVSGILADLGVSSHQIDIPERGFSFRYDGPLDMRMNKNQPKSAASILNEYSESAIEKMLNQYGDVSNSQKIARLIFNYKQFKPFQTTQDLVAALEPLTPKFHSYQFLAPIFQAIRIETNEEMKHLILFLEQAAKLLETNGKLVVLTYHSIEDRIVKHFMKSKNYSDDNADQVFGGSKGNVFEVLTKKAMPPSESEIAVNPRSRSAKLRAARKR